MQATKCLFKRVAPQDNSVSTPGALCERANVMRLLVVEDDDLLGSAVQKGLTRSGYAVDWIRNGADLALAMRTHLYE